MSSDVPVEWASTLTGADQKSGGHTEGGGYIGCN